MTRLNFDYPGDQHRRWKTAASRKGQSLKEWVRRALNQAAEDDEQQDEQRRRGR